MVLNQLLNAIYFMATKSAALLQTHRIQPKLGLMLFPFDMDMGGFMPVSGIKEKPIWPDF